MSFTHLIGKPYELGGRGPDTFDCYGLVMQIFKEKHGIILPDYKSPEDPAIRSDIILKEAERSWSRDNDGEVIYMRLGRGGHVAYNIGDGTFIHVWEEGGGVKIERMDNWLNRIVGIYKYKN